MNEQLNLEDEHSWNNRRKPPEIYESEKDRLIREIRDIENYLAALRTKLYELED